MNKNFKKHKTLEKSISKNLIKFDKFKHFKNNLNTIKN